MKNIQIVGIYLCKYLVIDKFISKLVQYQLRRHIYDFQHRFIIHLQINITLQEMLNI